MALEHVPAAPCAPGLLVVMCGMVGTGKSTVAEAVADAVLGRRDLVRSDAEASGWRHRRSSAPRRPPERGSTRTSEPGRSTRRSSSAPRPVALNPAASRRSMRHTLVPSSRESALRQWAAERGLRVLLIEVRCDEAVTLGQSRGPHPRPPARVGCRSGVPGRERASLRAAERMVVGREVGRRYRGEPIGGKRS